MKTKLILAMVAMLLLPSLVFGLDIKYPCAGMTSSDTILVYIRDMDDAQVDLNWGTPTGGITELANGDGTSDYWFTVTVDAGHAYDIKCRTTMATTLQIAKGSLTKLETSVDAIVSTRLPTASYTDNTALITTVKNKTDNLPASPAAVGSAMTLAPNQDVHNVTGSVTGSVGSVTAGVTVTTNNDKTGYLLSALPSIPNNWITSAGILAGAFNGKGDWTTVCLQSGGSVGAVTLAAVQPNYSPAKAGDAMVLTNAYDAAKNAASQGSVNALGTPLQASAYITPYSPAQIRQEMDANSIKLGADTPGTTTLLGRLTSTRAGYMDSLPTLASQSSLDAVFDQVIEGTNMTVRKMLRILLSALAGKASGGGTTLITFRDLNDTKNRIQATVDSHGNRTSVILNGD